MTQRVEIRCQGAQTVQVNHLVPFQGDLKDLSKENYEKLKAQILRLGFSEPISVWAHDGQNFILNGHQRVRTLRQMQTEGFEIPPIPINLVEASDEKDAKRKILALTSQFGEMTKDGLYEFMETNGLEIGEIEEAYRFPEIDMDDFKTEFYEEPAVEGLCDPDEIPEVKDSRVKPGDIWQLGRHRLMCGDSTSVDDVTNLMAGETADLVFTDPPYGVNYDGGHAVSGVRREKLANDDSTDIYADSVPLMVAFSKANAALYLWFAATKSLQVLQVLQENKYQVRSWLIWNKNMAQFGAIGAQYKQKHEPCLYCHKAGQAPFWGGPNNEISVWDEARASKNEFHPTQKPVGLSRRAIKNSCPADGIVLDLFGGSGSTLIGAEQEHRQARLMELSPQYCSVILARWEKFTGQIAERLVSLPGVQPPIATPEPLSISQP